MIKEWLDTVLGDVVEASNGSELRVDCPFCSARVGKPDAKHHMYISTNSPVAFCFRCGWQGNYISLIISVSGCSYPEALQQLESPTPNVSRFENLSSPMGLVMGHKMSAKPGGFRFFVDHEAQRTYEERAVWSYLVRKRQIPMIIVRKYMGWAPGTNRAWILVDGDFWQGRLIIPGDPKYLSSPWPKGDALWNPNALNDNHVIICEGVFSAIAVGSHAIALCGKTITDLQAKRIVKAHPASITIMLDADATQFSYDMAQTLVGLGYSGRLAIHELEVGDPTDSLDGRTLDYGWGAMVRNRISMTV
jgi:hypothetical protein